MNSFAHYSFGAVYQWMVENIGGIRSDGPAYQHIVIEPQLDPNLSWAKTSYRSIRGEISSSWARNDGTLTLEVVIPANTTATIHLPTSTSGEITESGRPLADAEAVKLQKTEDGRAVIEVGSGTYRFVSSLR
jgi:alpha-L-rhamnosidase